MTTLLNQFGQPMPPPAKARATEAPNLDPGFFLLDSEKTANTASVMQKPFAHHVWVYRCVSVIMQAVSTLSRMLKDKSGQTTNEHATLSLLGKPNQVMSGVQFFQTLIAQLLLPTTSGGAASGGQSFIIPWNTLRDSKVRLDKGEIPNELFPYSDNFFEPWYAEGEKNGRKKLLGWKFSIRRIPGTEIYFEHGEIIRVNLANPYDVLKGMSPFSPVAQAVEFDATSDIFNSDIFANSGHLDGQVSTDQAIPQAELDAIRDEWYKKYTGLHKKRVAFLTGGLKYEQFGLSSADLQYIEQQKWTRAKELGAYGLNRIGVGDYEDLNFATIREGRKMLWHDTYIPLDKMINDALSGQWISYLDQGRYTIVSDYTKVPALQSDMAERAKTGGTLCQQMGFPAALAARIVEIPLREEDLTKWPHLAEKPATSSPAPAIMSIKTKSIIRDYSSVYIEKVLDPAERSFKKDLDRFFVGQRNKIMDNVDAWLAKQKAIKADLPAAINVWEFLLDEEKEKLELLKIYKPNVKQQLQLEKNQVEADLGRGIAWDINEPTISYMVSKRSVLLEDIDTKTFNVARDAIDATVKQGMSEAVTPGEMAKRIKNAVHDVYEVRLGKPVEPNGLFDLGGMSSSRTIARTEMGTIASLARVDMYKGEGVKQIQWITAADDRVRESHAMVDGDIVFIGEKFSNGLEFPRDPSGNPGEVINCRCAFVAITEGIEE
jgi:SPP1 gp7 family putative phage head morphogenesis protein